MFESGVVIAVIVAVGQLAKRYMNAKYVPVVTMMLGIIGGYFYLPHETVQEAILKGVMLGLTSNGLFDMTKIVRK